MKKLYLVTLLSADRLRYSPQRCEAQTTKIIRAKSETDAVRTALRSVFGWAEWQHDEIGETWHRENKFYVLSVEGEVEA